MTSLMCFYCLTKGHTQKDCPRKIQGLNRLKSIKRKERDARRMEEYNKAKSTVRLFPFHEVENEEMKKLVVSPLFCYRAPPSALLKCENQTLKNELKLSNANTNEIREKYEACTSALKVAEARILDINAKNVSSAEQIEQLQKGNVALVKQVEGLHDENKSLAAKMKQQKEENESLEKQNKQQKEEIKSLVKQIEQLNVEKDTISQKNSLSLDKFEKDPFAFMSVKEKEHLKHCREDELTNTMICEYERNPKNPYKLINIIYGYNLASKYQTSRVAEFAGEIVKLQEENRKLQRTLQEMQLNSEQNDRHHRTSNRNSYVSNRSRNKQNYYQ